MSPPGLAAALAMLGLFAGACGTADPGGAGSGMAGAGSFGGGSGSNSGGSSGGGSAGGSGGGGGSGGSGSSGSGGTTTGGAGNGGGSGGGGGTASDGGMVSEGGTDAGTHADALGGGGGDVAPGTAPITQFLRIIQVTTVQGTQTVSISIDGQKMGHAGAIHAGQALMMRIHVRPDTGWVVHPTVAELHLVNAAADVILSATRTITGASSAANLDSTFNFDLTAAQVTKDLRFSVALRDPTGTPENPPPAIQRALYPRTGTLDTLDAQ